MSKFCGKCGSKLNEDTGLCPNCDNKNTLEKILKKFFKRTFFIKILIPILTFVILLVGFFTMDYFDIVGTGICKNMGLKPIGTFELYSDSDFVFTAEDNGQKIRFYCSPVKGYIPELSGDVTAEFFDDGDSSVTYDAVKNDGVFTAEVNIKENNIKTICVYAIAKKGLTYYKSNTIEIQVREDWTDKEYSAVEYVDNEIQTLMTGETYVNESSTEKFNSLQQLFTKLEEQGKVKKGTLYFDTEYLTISFEHLNGAWGYIDLEDSENNNILFGESAESLTNNLQQEVSNQNDINSSNSEALIIYDWYTDKPEVKKFYEDYKNEWKDKGLSTTLRVNPSVEQYATDFANKDLVLIAAHGGRYPINRGWFKKPNIYSTVCSNVKVSKEMDKKYKTEISSKNMVYSYLNDGKNKVYAFLPSFFSSHYNQDDLKNTIMLMDNCNGMGSNGDIDYDLSSALTGDKSAAVGFHNSVCIFKCFDRTNDTYYAPAYGTNFMKSMADYLMAGLTFSEAYEKTEKIYGSNQKLYMDDFWGSSDKEDETVFPMIVGNASAKLNLSKSDREFRVADKLLPIDSKYIISDKNAIYLRDSIVEKGKKIANINNTGQIMSNGETIYFTVSNGYNPTNGHEQYDVYSSDIFKVGFKKIFSGNYEVELIACKDNAIYYIDDEIPENGFVTFTTKLMRYDLSTNTSECVSENNVAASACYFNGKIYYSGVLMSADLIEHMSVFSYDLNSGQTEEVAKNSTMSKPSYLLTTDFLYFHTFKCINGKLTDQYLYYINKDGELRKSVQYPDDCILISVCEDNQTAILRKINKNNTFNNYTFDLNSEKISAINSGVSSLFWVSNDKKANNSFMIAFPFNSSGNKTSVSVAKLEGDKLVNYYVDEKKYVNVSHYDYWIEDGFWIDEDMDCHILNRK